MLESKFHEITEILVSLPEALGWLSKLNSGKPSINSLAFHEAKGIQPSGLLEATYTQGALSINIAADHLLVLKRALTLPVMTFAPWTISRTILEATSMGHWLFDCQITNKERVTRSLNLRLRDLQGQLEFGSEAITHWQDASNSFAKTRPIVFKRIQHLQEQEQLLGVNEKLDKKSRLIAFGSSMPSSMELAELTLGASIDYRMLPAVTHGRFWASNTLALRINEDELLMEKELTIKNTFYIVTSVIDWYSRAIWEHYKLHGWGLKATANILEEQCDSAHLNPITRFWRKDYLNTIRPPTR